MQKQSISPTDIPPEPGLCGLGSTLGPVTRRLHKADQQAHVTDTNLSKDLLLFVPPLESSTSRYVIECVDVFIYVT